MMPFIVGYLYLFSFALCLFFLSLFINCLIFIVQFPYMLINLPVWLANCLWVRIVVMCWFSDPFLKRIPVGILNVKVLMADLDFSCWIQL